MNVGDLIKHYRKKTKLSHEQLAERTGLSKSCLNVVENDKPTRSPRFEAVVKVVLALDIDLYDLAMVYVN